MSTFIGKYEAKADVKGRVFVPSAYRRIISSEDRLVIRKETENNCLVLYPEKVWNVKVEQLKSNLDDWNSVDQMILMQFVSDAEWLEIDAQGRILISKRQMESIVGGGNEVLFVGMIDRIAIWDKAEFERMKVSVDDFGKLLKEKMDNNKSSVC